MFTESTTALSTFPEQRQVTAGVSWDPKRSREDWFGEDSERRFIDFDPKATEVSWVDFN